MKIKTLSFLFLAAILITSCTEKNPLLRKWKLDHIDVSALMVGLPKGLRDTLTMMMDQENAAQKGKMAYDFKENGKVIIHSPDLLGNWKKINGKWIFNEEEELLTIKLEKKEDEYIVHALTEDQLIIELVDRRAENSLSGVVNGKRQGTKVKSVFKASK